MVEADVSVDFFAEMGKEGGVGGEGADDVDALGAGFFEGGDEDFDFFGAEESGFAGVWVEAGHGEASGASVDGGEGLVGEGDDFEDALGGEEGGDGVEGDVGGDEGAGDFLGGEHHGVVWGVGNGGEVFGVGWVGNAGEVPCFFVNGVGDDGGVVTGEGAVDGGFEAGEGVSAGGGGDFSDLDGCGEGEGDEVFFGKGKVEFLGEVGEVVWAADEFEVGEGRVGEEFEGDFGPDPGGISLGDDEGFIHLR